VTKLVFLAIGLVILVALGDLLLLHLESMGWINYRRRGLSRSGAAFHTLKLHSIFDPAAEQIVEAKYSEEKEQDESGDTSMPEREDDS